MRLRKLLGQQHRLADKGQLAEGIGHAVKGIQAHESCFKNLPTLTEDHFLAFRRRKACVTSGNSRNSFMRFSAIPA